MPEDKEPFLPPSEEFPPTVGIVGETHPNDGAAPLEDLSPAAEGSDGSNGAAVLSGRRRLRRVWVGDPPSTLPDPQSAPVIEAEPAIEAEPEAVPQPDALAVEVDVSETLPASPASLPELDSKPETPDLQPAGDTPVPVAEKKRESRTYPQWLRVVRVVWTHRGVWLGLAAIIMSAYGQAALFQEDRRVQAAWLLVGAMVLAIGAWSGIPDVALLTQAPGPRRRFLQLVKWRRGLALRLAGIGASLWLLWASFQAWYAKPQEVFGSQGYLWLASMALLLLSCARWYPTGKEEKRLEPRWTRRELIVLSIIMLVALVTRLAWLEEFPWRIDPNEWLAWNESIKFMQDPPTMSVFTTTWLETGLPSMYFWFEAIPMRLFGDGLAWIRFLTAFLGAVFVIPIYLLARLLWGRIAGVVAATLVVGSSTLIQHTRMTNNNISTTIFWTFCFYFLLRGLRSRKPGDFVWAGLFAGTSMYTYYGTRLLPYVLLAFLGYMIVFHFRAFRERIGHFALVVVGFVVGFGPLIAYFTRNPDKWAGRGIYEMIIPPTIPNTWELVVSDWNVVTRESDQELLEPQRNPRARHFLLGTLLPPS